MDFWCWTEDKYISEILIWGAYHDSNCIHGMAELPCIALLLPCQEAISSSKRIQKMTLSQHIEAAFGTKKGRHIYLC